MWEGEEFPGPLQCEGVEVVCRRWSWRWSFLDQALPFKGSLWYLYKRPIQKRMGDLQGRIVHGAIATNRHRAHLDPGVWEGYILCGECETVTHLCVGCSRLTKLFRSS